MVGYEVRRRDAAAEALAAAEPFLARRRVDHNMLLTILHDRVASPEPGRYWCVRDGREVCGFALQSPPDFSAALARVGSDVLALLVAAMVTDAPDLPGVIAEAGVAAGFAGQWAEVARVPAFPVEAQRLYRLGTPRRPRDPAARARPAGLAERDLLLEWLRQFQREVGDGPRGTEDRLPRALGDGRVWVWERGRPVAMAGVSAPVAGVARIGPVFTPPAERGRGYASALVAELSVRALDGADHCILYTQLSNPTSNAIYRAIGYEPVSEILRYRFGSAA